jgi:hypothetical protein
MDRTCSIRDDELEYAERIAWRREERRVSAVGRAHPHIEVKIIDLDGKIVPRGRRVGKASGSRACASRWRAHHLGACAMVGTAQGRLCPPYEFRVYFHTGSAMEYFTWLSAKLDSIEAMPSSRVSLFFKNAS